MSFLNFWWSVVVGWNIPNHSRTDVSTVPKVLVRAYIFSLCKYVCSTGFFCQWSLRKNYESKYPVKVWLSRFELMVRLLYFISCCICKIPLGMFAVSAHWVWRFVIQSLHEGSGVWKSLYFRARRITSARCFWLHLTLNLKLTIVWYLCFFGGLWCVFCTVDPLFLWLSVPPLFIDWLLLGVLCRAGWFVHGQGGSLGGALLIFFVDPTYAVLVALHWINAQDKETIWLREHNYPMYQTKCAPNPQTSMYLRLAR